MGYSREVYDAALAALEKRRIDAVNRAAALKDRMAAKYPRVREIEAMMAGCSVQVAKAVLDGGDVEAAVERFHGKYPGQPVRLDVGTDRLVLADLSHLSEAVCNLLCNGYEAAVQAGREEPQVVLRVRAERMWTVLEVEDNGPGIPPERQGKIFEPFVTSKNTNYNWGMGLYYVRKIVRSHLGRLRLESRDGEGARFQIMLPLYDPRQKE